MRFARVLLLLILTLADVVLGADITNNNFKIARSPLSELLSQQTVRQTFQDDAGLLWFSTQEGLFRYDGYEVRKYHASDQSQGGISHNNVYQVLQDHSGKIWVATGGGGLHLYDPDTRKFQSFSAANNGSQLLTNNVTTLMEDANGYIWIGYLEGAISLFDPFEGSIQHLDKLNHDASTKGGITSFAKEGEEHIWIGTTNSGLIRYNIRTRTITLFHKEGNGSDALSSKNITSLLNDDDGGLWIGTKSNGLMLMDFESATVTRFSHRPDQESTLSNNSINTLYRDHVGRIWVGTDSGLNLHVDTNRFKKFTDANSNLATDVVLNVLQDNQGNFWIGTHYGLFTGFQSKFDIFDSKRGLPSQTITSFAETANGNLWIGSYDGLFLLDPRAGEFMKAETIIPGYRTKDSRIMALHYHANSLWVGYRANGVERVQNIDNPDTQSIVAFKKDSGLSSNAITHIMADRQDNTWISTFGGGINMLSKGISSPVGFRSKGENSNTLSSDSIFQIAETRDGTLLVAASNGLNTYNQSTNILSALKSDSRGDINLENAIIQSAHESGEGNIWLGLHYRGLAVWQSEDRQRQQNIFNIVKTTPPLPSSTVYAIEEDNAGYLWLSTTNGLVRLDPSTLQIITFDYSDGLQDNEFNFGASFKDSQGRLYFGGNKGYNRFLPENIVQQSEPPPMIMTNVMIAGEPVEFDPAYKNPGTLHLTHEDTFVNFEFSAQDYTAPQKNRYQYKLKNFDSQWVDTGERHNISFTSLPSGIYQLQIKGANSDGVWNHEGLKMTLKVYPSPWLTWWAFSCYGAILVWLFWFFRKYYDNYLIKERATKVAASMHVTAERAMDDLQDQLDIERTLIRNVHAHSKNTLGVIEGLLDRQAETIGDESILELFADNQLRFSCLQALEHNLYYTVDRLEVNFRAFIEDLVAIHFHRQPHAHVDIAVVNEANDMGIPADIAVPAALITNELFCNSIKHAFDTVTGVHYIRIALKENVQLNAWTLEISDSGSGLPENIDPNNPTTLGMELVLHFTHALNAELTVKRHKGTHFTVKIPKPPPEG